MPVQASEEKLVRAPAQGTADRIASIIHKHVKSEPDKNFIDRRWLVGVPEAAQEIAALALHEGERQSDLTQAEVTAVIDWAKSNDLPIPVALFAHFHMQKRSRPVADEGKREPESVGDKREKHTVDAVDSAAVDGTTAPLRSPPESSLPALWKAIVDHTASDEMFWIGEILLSELTKETGFHPAAPDTEGR
jgi:hypothetical protein